MILLAITVTKKLDHNNVRSWSFHVLSKVPWIIFTGVSGRALSAFVKAYSSIRVMLPPKVVSIGKGFIQKVVILPDKLVSLIVFKGTGFPKYTIRSQLIFYTFNLSTFAKNSYNV